MSVAAMFSRHDFVAGSNKMIQYRRADEARGPGE
jgi:hypothetical protein